MNVKTKSIFFTIWLAIAGTIAYVLGILNLHTIHGAKDIADPASRLKLSIVLSIFVVCVALVLAMLVWFSKPIWVYTDHRHLLSVVAVLVLLTTGVGYGVQQQSQKFRLEEQLISSQQKILDSENSLRQKQAAPETPPAASPQSPSPITSTPAPVAKSTQPSAAIQDTCDSSEKILSRGAGQSNADSNYSGYLNSKAFYTGNSTYTPDQQQQKIIAEYTRYKGYVDRDYDAYVGQMKAAGCTPKTSRPLFGNP